VPGTTMLVPTNDAKADALRLNVSQIPADSLSMQKRSGADTAVALVMSWIGLALRALLMSASFNFGELGIQNRSYLQKEHRAHKLVRMQAIAAR
jgi:hypothetical protein